MVTCTTENAEETIEIGEQLSAKCKAGDVIVLSGDLGAGKTQLAKGFAKGLGVTDEITSPTFNIMSEYKGTKLDLLHFDLYRLETPKELDDIDYFANLESGAVCLVEWGDKFEDVMPKNYVQIYIETLNAEVTEEERALSDKLGSIPDFDSPEYNAAFDELMDYYDRLNEQNGDAGSFKCVVEQGVRQDILNGAEIDVDSLRYMEIDGFGKRGRALEKEFTKLLME